ncbi:DUF2061 domain-containing protein [Asticcacaulis excentricus]|uniref:DUF2061 domain-containing protein n=1 Tax=Asticcacaulis excentricus (strain ATCC 15261 / DSM 4724 / KCTC 12464 / NCIMB 9791 / VKM B-1370 / CB 48) TaxID=573065 RepID=E8RTL4_ASTEC|nr:DUF2061 domain-containing protein [Asticcacaulis excentricus]ADU14835.1 Protein of unknown function DUF2061, membrane [Asticcacaulis excentricus CB 48]
MRLIAKTLSYGTIHVLVASTVAFVLTGNWAIALGIGLIEPVVQTLVFPLHEYLWERKAPEKLSLFHSH